MSKELAEAAAKKATREAAERAAKAAKKAAADAAKKAAASASKTAAKTAADAAEKAAKAAKKAAKEAADEAAALAKEAAKPGATPATKKAAKEAAERATKLSKLADEASDTAKSAKKAVKGSKATAKKAAAVLAAGGAVAGGVLWIDNELKKADKKIKDCMKVCLPDNWDDYIYGESVKKSELTYKEIEEDLGDQPLCTKKIKDCGEYCEKKCTELHDKDLPGGKLLDRVKRNTTDFFDDLNPFKGMGDVVGKVLFGFTIFIAVLIVGTIFYFLYKFFTRPKT